MGNVVANRTDRAVLSPIAEVLSGLESNLLRLIQDSATAGIMSTFSPELAARVVAHIPGTAAFALQGRPNLEALRADAFRLDLVKELKARNFSGKLTAKDKVTLGRMLDDAVEARSNKGATLKKLVKPIADFLKS